MPQRYKQIFGRVTEFEYQQDGVPFPIQVEAGGFMLCIKGECEVVIDLIPYRIKCWDMVMALPFSTVQLLHRSEDFDGYIVGVSADFFSNVELANKGSYFTTIKNNPCISLTREEGERVLALRSMLIYLQSDSEHQFRSEIDESVMKIILYETLGIYNKRAPKTHMQCSRDDTIFYTFIAHFFNNYKKNRDLSYYAQLQHITSGHLSKVIKRASSRTATDWISDYTIINIKVCLRNKSISIAAIAEEFNFPNASFFSQYFKKHTGITPSAFRRML